MKRVSGLWSWGWNPHGQLGRDDKGGLARKTEEPNLLSFGFHHNVIQVSCGPHYTAVVTSNGDLFTWGDGGFGKLGHGDTEDVFIPKKVTSIRLVQQVATGTAHALCVADGKPYSWGSNFFGALGLPQKEPSLEPKLIVSLRAKKTVPTQIAAFGNHSALVDDQGALYTWGMNKYGQLGLGSVSDKIVDTPTAVPKLPPMVRVELGEKHTVALSQAGEVWSFGSNEFGQLGANTQTENIGEPMKIRVGQREKVRTIACGAAFSLAITANNNVYTWGCSDKGQTGHIQATYTATDKSYAIDTRNKYTPKLVEAEYVVDESADKNSKKSTKFRELLLSDISCGFGHCAGLDESKRLWTWGWDKHGELGYREELESLGPRRVEVLRKVDSIACGGYHNIALLRDKYVAIQLACDNNYTNLSDLLRTNSELVKEVDDENGFTCLHWAAHLGNAMVVSILLSYLDLLTMQDHKGRTPLHLAAIQGHKDIVSELSRVCGSSDLNITDNYACTPLHYATKNGHMEIAKLLISRGAEATLLDLDGKTPLFYCSDLKNAFALKVIADMHDITLIAQSDSDEFARKLAKEIELHHVKCYLPVQGTNYSQKIVAGKGVLFIVSEDSVKSEDCFNKLKEAKQANKAIFSIWYHKVAKLDSTLESLIFRRQLADFSDPAKFNDAISGLVGGLQKIAAQEEIEEEMEQAESDDPALAQIDQSDIGSHAYVFLISDTSDKQVAAEVEQKLTDNEIKTKRPTESLQQTSKHILHCAAIVIILSESSLASKKVHDQVALAENHKKPLFPVFLRTSLSLDPAMQYTFAEAPRFYLNKACLDQLVNALQISFKIMQYRTSIAQHALAENGKEEKKDEKK